MGVSQKSGGFRDPSNKSALQGYGGPCLGPYGDCLRNIQM